MPLIATPIIFPRAFTIALPVAPCPLLPIKSTLGGPHLRTFVLQFGRDGAAGIASAISLIPSAKFASLSNPILSAIVSNVSYDMAEEGVFQTVDFTATSSEDGGGHLAVIKAT